jgi:predicted acetyltransferase
MGLGKDALPLSLAELGSLGEKQALVTVDADNAASIKVIEACGGKLEGDSVEKETGIVFRRYWIET